jgi:hypothetical protein
VVIKYDETDQKFIGFTLSSADDGFPIEGGKGYIVNVPMGGFIRFEGTAWMDAAPENPLISSDQDVWAFIVSGKLAKGDKSGENSQKYTAIIRNLRTGSETMANIDQTGYFAGVWADLNRKSVIKAGDRIEVSVIDNNKKIVSGGFIKEITNDELRNATLDIKLKIGDIIPKMSMLLQNYPNPFNPETWIPFQLREDSDVQIQIFDISGRLVRKLDLGHKSAGVYINSDKAAYWDGKNETGERISSGVYFYNIQAGKLIATKKMIVMQ